MTRLKWQRAVIKVGSALVSPEGKGASAQYLLAIARFINESRLQGKEVIVVSSGSVAVGRQFIKTGLHPTVAERQAMAAIGQTSMMANWSRFFDFPCAQILLTVDYLNDRTRYVNIKNALRELLENGALPIVNEDDSVAFGDIKVGDNDNLAAHTAIVTEADTLIICTDVDGLFTANPRTSPNAKLIPEVDDIDENILALAGGAGSALGTGGMITKLEAAQKTTACGIQTLLVNGKDPDVFTQLTRDRCIGTRFKPKQAYYGAKDHWISQTMKPQGMIEIDDGAYRAITEKGASLLPAGIVSVNGNFTNDDAVSIYYKNKAVAKGICLYSNTELASIIGKRSAEIHQTLGFSHGEEVIHRDHLVLIENNDLQETE